MSLTSRASMHHQTEYTNPERVYPCKTRLRSQSENPEYRIPSKECLHSHTSNPKCMRSPNRNARALQQKRPSMRSPTEALAPPQLGCPHPLNWGAAKTHWLGVLGDSVPPPVSTNPERPLPSSISRAKETPFGFVGAPKISVSFPWAFS